MGDGSLEFGDGLVVGEEFAGVAGGLDDDVAGSAGELGIVVELDLDEVDAGGLGEEAREGRTDEAVGAEEDYPHGGGISHSSAQGLG